MPEAEQHDYAMHPAQRYASTDKRPSTKQVYCLAHELCDALELDWPKDRADASALIRSLKARKAGADTRNDDCPF